ncbi:hypothetical protein [Allomuricauda sp. d1]|uniref:hypothetical protein n=1 Tax=Allomuricauda sp. d1 TaxID=3136725 RepID=UPI0031CF6945
MRPIQLCIAFIFILFVFQGYSQEPKPITVESFGYDFADEKYDFGNFSVSYPLNPSTDIILRGFNEKTPAFEIFRSQLVLRKKIAKKLYGVGGIQYEWDFTSMRNGINMINPRGDSARKEILIEIEYEPKEDMFIQAGFRQLLNTPKFAPQGFSNPDGKGALYLGSKWKF